MPPYQALLVDDERLARQKLRHMLAAHEAVVDVVAEADSVATAVAAIAQHQPNLLFLDIQMPGESGFDVLHQVEPTFHVIFVTAFDQHALRAFEVNALDYLLKPVHPARLTAALERLQQKTPAPITTEQSSRQLDYDDHLFLSADDPPLFIRVQQIVCIQAAGAYSEIYLENGEKRLALKSLRVWENQLPAKYFARIHRATIVNLTCVERMDKWFNYTYRVHVRHIAEPFTMSRRYAAQLKQQRG